MILQLYRYSGQYEPGFVASGPDDVEGIEHADRTVANSLQMLASAQKVYSYLISISYCKDLSDHCV